MAGPLYSPPRRGILAAGAAGTAGLILGGCASGARSVRLGPEADVSRWAPGPGTSLKGARRDGGVITAWATEAQSYDPAIGWDLHSWDAISTVLHSPLYTYAGQDGGPAPMAAAAMPKVSRDGRVYTIPLRRNVRFHNGRLVTAQDYVESLTRVLDPAVASWAASYLFGIEGAEGFYKQKAKRVTGLSALDPHTLQIHLSEPDILMLPLLCQPYTVALPAEEIKRLGKAFGRTPVGTGPFRITSYDGKGQRATFQRFDDYFWPGTPLIESIEYRWGIDYGMQSLQLQGGSVDILGEGLVASQAAKFTADEKTRGKFVRPIPVRGTQWLSLNLKRRELRDRRVRQALNWAVDRDQLMRVTFGLSDPWGLPFPKNLSRYRPTAKPYTYDPDRARSLLREAGVRRLRLDFPLGTQEPWPLLAQVLQQQLAEVGVDIDLRHMGQPAFDQITAKGEGDIYGNRYYLSLNSGLDVVQANYTSDASYNYTGYRNHRVDTLTAKARRSRSVEEANSLLTQIEEEILADAPSVFLANMNFLAGRAPDIHNYQMRGETSTYYDRLWIGR
ncbi:ABC transporter substrate-binding protein [Streptomyces sp. NPDC093223]|uniref:ABC transporter substrate-binding protein n=1 Tax=Streptomyces sp. NPDC093223 TaxID=3366033 RepID=UPI00381B596E